KADYARADVHHRIVGGDDAAANLDPAPHVQRRIAFPARMQRQGAQPRRRRERHFEADRTAERKAAIVELVELEMVRERDDVLSEILGAVAGFRYFGLPTAAQVEKNRAEPRL